MAESDAQTRATSRDQMSFVPPRMIAQSNGGSDASTRASRAGIACALSSGTPLTTTVAPPSCAAASRRRSVSPYGVSGANARSTPAVRLSPNVRTRRAIARASTSASASARGIYPNCRSETRPGTGVQAVWEGAKDTRCITTG